MLLSLKFQANTYSFERVVTHFVGYYFSSGHRVDTSILYACIMCTVHICMYVRMYVCMYVCVYVHVHVCTGFFVTVRGNETDSSVESGDLVLCLRVTS